MEITWRVIRGEEEGERGEKGTGNKKHNGRYKTDKERLKIEYEMEKPKNLYVLLMDMN